MTPAPTGNAGLHVRYEKAGLILDALPVPFNADAVIVEANVRLPKKTPRVKADFTLRWSAGRTGHRGRTAGGAKTPKKPMRVNNITAAERGLAVADRTHSRRSNVGETSRCRFSACWASSMASRSRCRRSASRWARARSRVRRSWAHKRKSVVAAAVFARACLLASVNDLNLRVQMKRRKSDDVQTMRIALTPEQMSRRRAGIVTVTSCRKAHRHRLVRNIIGGSRRRCVHVNRFRTISKKTLMRSLRVTSGALSDSRRPTARFADRARLPMRQWRTEVERDRAFDAQIASLCSAGS